MKSNQLTKKWVISLTKKFRFNDEKYRLEKLIYDSDQRNVSLLLNCSLSISPLIFSIYSKSLTIFKRAGFSYTHLFSRRNIDNLSINKYIKCFIDSPHGPDSFQFSTRCTTYGVRTESVVSAPLSYGSPCISLPWHKILN